MSNNNNHPLGEAPWFHVILSTGFGTGFIPGAPGTAGAFLAMIIWYAIYLLTGATATLLCITLALVIVTTVVGAWTSRIMERYWGEDPRTVVIDEFVGTWIPLLAAATPDYLETSLLGLLGFGAFRIIDISDYGIQVIDQPVMEGPQLICTEYISLSFSPIIIVI